MMEQVHTRSVVEAAIALVGLWLLLWQIPDFASSIYIVLTDQEELSPRILEHHAVHLAGHSLIGLLLIVLRNKVANWLVPSGGSVSFHASAIVGPGVALIGVYFLAVGVISLGESFAVQRTPNLSNPFLYWRGLFACAVGISLFIGSVGIARIWSFLKGLRRAGV